MATIEDIITIEDLSFGFNGHEVLSDISLRIAQSRFTVFIGRNGSGKSTLLRLMAGLIPYKYGSVKLHGTEIGRMSFKERAKRIAFLAQQHRAVFPFTVEEVVLTGRAAHVGYFPSELDREITAQAIRKAGIAHLQDRIYTELSGGEQQLVMIARTLAQQPEVILLDEPVSHLDYKNQIGILSLVKKLAQSGTTVIAVIHDPNLAFLYGDRFVYFHDRKVYEMNDGKAWEHKLTRDIFHEDILTIEHGGRCIFIPHLP